MGRSPSLIKACSHLIVIEVFSRLLPKGSNIIMRQTWLCIYHIFIISCFTGFCGSEVIYLHMNVMQRSSYIISSVKGNGSSMKRCSKDSKMCICKYNLENDARLSLTQLILTNIIFFWLFFWTELCLSVLAALLSAVQDEVRWNHIFLGIACFCLLTDLFFMLYWMWHSCSFWH